MPRSGRGRPGAVIGLGAAKDLIAGSGKLTGTRRKTVSLDARDNSDELLDSLGHDFASRLVRKGCRLELRALRQHHDANETGCGRMITPSAPSEIRVLLFDVGGVLVQLSGVDVMLDWLGNRISADDLWPMWLQSTPVRQFETGKIDASEFAVRVISEFGLSVEPQRFLEAFVGWPTGLYPGTLEMLARIPRSYRRAILSNSNALHWPRVLNDMQLGAAFDSHFVSHLTGRIKPDADAFEHVVESLKCSPTQVLFLDDNLLNVEAAQRFGMRAMRVRGVTETHAVLTSLGIIDGRQLTGE